MTLLLGFLGIFSIQELFGWNQNNAFAYWTVFSYANLAFFYALTNFPRSQKVTSNKTFPFLAIIQFSCKYILIPAVAIYFIILYAYSIKVLFDFNNWPK